MTAQELREARFSTVVRGYSMTEVDALLSRIERQLAPLDFRAAESAEGDAHGAPDEE
ncbi:DivIVA domain-containing protein [Nocardioides alcanivorans]|uniref:DivIVA domain-containing protein n=1 Tax=Nocardioides alcanivorans TaxID=2897352 RepID=UPI001F35D4D2|nr:DivIVA domain-containing protein [Nocardioides alcanivorans]